MPQLIIAEEAWSDLWADAKALAEAHFREVDEGVEPKRKFCLDEPLMEKLVQLGCVLVFGARLDDTLVGYCTWQIAPDVESKGLLVAWQGAWYMDPEHAGVGGRLFDASVARLRELGVQCVFPHHRVQGRGKDLSAFFAARGAKLIQHTYSLWIGA